MPRVLALSGSLRAGSHSTSLLRHAAVRAGDVRNRATAQWVQGVRLPPLEKINIPASLIVPSPMGARGRGIEVWQGAAKESTVEELLQRGTDFDRVTVF